LSLPAAFWDSSALVPMFAEQPASRWADALARVWDVTVWWATPVEISSAIARLQREKTLSVEKSRAAMSLVYAARGQWQEIVPTDAVRGEAQRLLAIHPLRAADSLQLAAAMVWCRDRPKGRTFLCADSKLADAAEKIGFAVLRP
jgi:uncharacterized protein